jgi:hypothetical protein
MLYPTTEYAYVDEYGQHVDPTNYSEQIYTDNYDRITTQSIGDGNTFDYQQQQQYQAITIDGSQPL